MKTISFYMICALVLSFALSGQAQAASITGTVTFEGVVPAPELLSTDADPSCSAVYPDGLESDAIVVNDGKLKNAFIYIKEGIDGSAYKAPEEPVVLDQNGCRYTPRVVGLQTGQPLQLINSDSTLHNVHAMAKSNKEFNLGMPIQGMKSKKTFSEAEVMVKFKCDVHPWMAAYAGVVDHPFFAVSDDDGSINIENVPAGDYVLEAWHEVYGVQTTNVSIADEGEEKNIEFNFKAA